MIRHFLEDDGWYAGGYRIPCDALETAWNTFFGTRDRAKVTCEACIVELVTDRMLGG